MTLSDNILQGLYRHWKGGYYVVLGVSIGCGKDNEDVYFVNYQNVLHPEFGMFTRPLTEFFEEVHDDKYYQTQRFVHIDKLEGSDEDMLKNISTQDLIGELRRRTDSPIHDLDIKGLESDVFCRDYVVGYEEYPKELPGGRMTDKGVSYAVPFQDRESAKDFLDSRAGTEKRMKLFRRTYIRES